MHVIEPARPEELDQALELIFARLEPERRRQQCAQALALMLEGQIDPAGIFVAREDGQLLGAQACIPLRGASALLWVPRLRVGLDVPELADALVRKSLDWLRSRNLKVAQAILPAEDLPDASPLLRQGFTHVTGLLYLSHDLSVSENAPPRRELRCDFYSPANHELFLKTLERTYEGTLDCPELCGRRTLEEIVEGHRQQGIFHPELWWLAWDEDRPAGVVLITEIPGGEGWDLSYVGVVPEARGRGIGRELTLRVLEAAQGSWVPQLLCAVDVRNHPARQLYEKIGFRVVEERAVLLFFFADLAESRS